jgi:hypothetical protein
VVLLATLKSTGPYHQHQPGKHCGTKQVCVQTDLRLPMTVKWQATSNPLLSNLKKKKT